MARPKKAKRINDKPSEFIEENFLKENPETLPEELPVQVFKEVPKMDKIVFRNDRDPGIPLEFHYASKTHPLKQYKLIHGEVYELPIEIIEHLEQCSIPNYAYRKGRDGHPEMYITSQRYMFQCKVVRDGQVNQRYAA